MNEVKNNFNDIDLEDLVEKKKVSKKWLDANEYLAQKY